MQTLSIDAGTGKSSIYIGQTLKNVEKYLPTQRVVIITDENVWQHYHQEFPTDKVIQIGMGEQIKTLDTVNWIYQQLMDLEVDRSCFILGIGGGIVCDITGFVASTYLRGVRFGFVSSTLLAQVDASVGGKNGVNYKSYKNMVGVFNQPEFVICDLTLFSTLPCKEVLCGMAEIVKHAAIYDKDMFAYLERNFRKALDLDLGVLEKLVYYSVLIKSTVVNKDEKEKGERRKLNFGHTFGHAIEKLSTFAHGEAISIGMVIAARISTQRMGLTKPDADRLRDLIGSLGLPVELTLDKSEVVSAIRKDKKREGDDIHFILLDRLGHAVVEVIPLAELSKEL